MKIEEQIKYWKPKFRLLKKWEISYGKDGDHIKAAEINYNKKTALILPYGKGRIPNDYAFHELLHVCVYSVRNAKKNLQHELEEVLVQDLCKIFFMKER